MGDINTSVFLLEGARFAGANNTFTMCPRSVITNKENLNNNGSSCEYIVFSDSTNDQSDIADSDLKFYWSKNSSSVNRFDYDSFNKRWSLSPGGPTDNLGVISNSPRLKCQFSDETQPMSVYAGDRSYVFGINFVEDEYLFTDQEPKSIQINKKNGEINFSQADVDNAALKKLKVYATRHSFFDRIKSNGAIGKVSGFLVLNPMPGHASIPMLRIGYRTYLTPIEVDNESNFSNDIDKGSFQWSLNTGVVNINKYDKEEFISENVYYDGLSLGVVSLTKEKINVNVNNRFPSSPFSNPNINNSENFYLFLDNGNTREYFNLVVQSSAPSNAPDDSTIVISNGNAYMSNNTLSKCVNSDLYYINNTVEIEHGVSLQFFRSAVNSSGIPTVKDFTTYYSVSKQIITNALLQAPFVPLPTVPIDDESIKVNIDGSSGSFSGELKSSSNVDTKLGFGLNFDKKQLNFTSRSSYSLQLNKKTSSIKLNDAIISEVGFAAKLNGESIKPGVDFTIDYTTGLMEFLKPVGENEVKNIINTDCIFTSPNTITLTEATIHDVDKQKIVVINGSNSGVYSIVNVVDSSKVTVDKNVVNGTGSCDIITGIETVADRFFVNFNPKFKKIKVYRGFEKNVLRELSNQEFSIIPSVSQITLTEPSKQNEIFKIEYLSLDTTDEVNFTSNSRSEFASFKVRQEAVVDASGTILSFNEDNHDIDITKPMTLVVGGVTQSSKLDIVNNKINFGSKVSEQAFVTYFVLQSQGGDTNFKLSYSPLDVDFPVITVDEKTSIFSGDCRDVILGGSLIMANSKDLFLVDNVIYDEVNNNTNVTFTKTPKIDSERSQLKISKSITVKDFLVGEVTQFDVCVKGSSVITVQGDKPYRPGMVFLIDGDPYYSISIKYDEKQNKTSIALAAQLSKNYALPSVSYTVRPIFNSTSEFSTLSRPHLDYKFSLYGKKLYVKDIDYMVSDNGIINMLDNDIGINDVIYATYVGHVENSIGSNFDLSYAYATTPNSQNGLLGQSLAMSYRLRSPDTFFFKVGSVKSFIPDVIEELKKSNTQTPSGPNISNSKSLKNKDYGGPGLYFDEQHYSNIDVVVSSILKFYNDTINSYEDILGSIDGRVVGGLSGKFRFDGDNSGNARSSYADVKNDIDDRITIRKDIVMTGFGSGSPPEFTFEDRSVYNYMWDYNPESRFFPTLKKTSVAINGQTNFMNFGNTLGSLGIGNITSVDYFSRSLASSKFDYSDGNKLIIQKNGDVEKLIPQFNSGMGVNIHNNNGDVKTELTISGVTNDSQGVVMTLSGSVPLKFGSITQKGSGNDDRESRYVVGKDISVNRDDGRVVNMSFPPIPLIPLQTEIKGNELLDADVYFMNRETAPYRFPSLDGLELDDDGRQSFPPVSYDNEIDLYNYELWALKFFGNGSVNTLTTINNVSIDITPAVGDVIIFQYGVNVGLSRTIINVLATSGSYVITVGVPFTSISVQSEFFKIIRPNLDTVEDTVNKQIKVLEINVGGEKSGLITTIPSTLNSVFYLFDSFGETVLTSDGEISDDETLHDPDLIGSKVRDSDLLLIKSGPNTGIYLIKSVTANNAVITKNDDWHAFPGTGNISYSVVRPSSLLNIKEFILVSKFLKNTYDWIITEKTWVGSINVYNMDDRIQKVNGRIEYIKNFISDVASTFKSLSRYDSRFMWITQRLDKKTGLIMKKTQSVLKRMEAAAKLKMDLQKELVMKQLM